MANNIDEMAIHYPAHIDEIKRRHDQALERAGAAHAVIFSGAEKGVFLDDAIYPFKPNPHFLNWLPLTTLPLCFIVYTPREQPCLIYYQPEDYWHKPPDAPSGYWVSYFDIRVVHTVEAIAQHLPERKDRCILIGEVHDPKHSFGMDRVNPTTAMHFLHYARGVKTQYELACMREANVRAARGHLAAERVFRNGGAEYDIHLAYCMGTGHTENELPYSNITALNKNAAVMHYQHQERQAPAKIRSFLIDAGASVNGYAADVTRTYSFDDAAFQAFIDSADSMQRNIVSMVREGQDYRALHLMTHRLIAGLLNELEITSGSDEALLSSGVTAAFYPHGLGHLLGLQVHDVGGFMADDSGAVIEPPDGHPFLRLTRSLEVDQVLTIEPGVYFIDMLLAQLREQDAGKLVNWDVVERFRPFGGMRIEDNVRVLADGQENLTRDAFAAIGSAGNLTS